MIKKQISDIDKRNYVLLRKNVSSFIEACAQKYDQQGKLLDIAPQVHEGASPFFKKTTIETLDIDPASHATYVADICRTNSTLIPNNRFTFVVCTEVLEHTRQPFAAIDEIYRILKRGGYLFLSTPFNFRIHGPLPDCWRFTEHGLLELLKNFRKVDIQQLETEDRWLMPIHYTAVAKK